MVPVKLSNNFAAQRRSWELPHTAALGNEADCKQAKKLIEVIDSYCSANIDDKAIKPTFLQPGVAALVHASERAF